MKAEIASTIVAIQSTNKPWNEIVERCGQTNPPQLYQVKKELRDLKQNNLSVSEYYCKLKDLPDLSVDVMLRRNAKVTWLNKYLRESQTTNL